MLRMFEKLDAGQCFRALEKNLGEIKK